MKKRFSTTFLTLLITISLFGVSFIAEGFATTNRVRLPISIFVSIGPHLDFCRQIGGDRVSAQLLLPPGKSPATYAPSPQQIQALSRAQLFFKIGLPFEKTLLGKIKALPKHPQIIDTQAGITLQPMHNKLDNRDQSAHHDDHHHHSGLDPHSWLDPRLALKQAATICETLSHIDPDGKELYLNNFNILSEKLKDLHENLTRALEPFAGNTIFVYHPAFGYFARAYKLHQLAVEIEGKRPKAKKLVEFIKKAQAKRARVIFVQPQFDQQSAKKIAGMLNCAVIPIDPLAQDYCVNLDQIAKTIRDNIKADR